MRAGIRIERWITFPVAGRLRRSWRGFCNYRALHGRLPLRRGFGRYGWRTLDMLRLEDPRVGLVIVEDARQYPYAITLAKRAGKNVIALPQNIESLYTAHSDGTGAVMTGRLLGREAGILGQADAVATIAREEQWLLRGLGVDASYFPYFPPEPLATQFRSIRNRRSGTSSGPAVILGNAGNVLNRQGMERLLDEMGNLFTDPDRELVLVGYCTDGLRSHPHANRVRILGELSDSDFYALLEWARAVVIPQEFGAGSPTKITEMLLAGLPVLASEMASRSHFEYSGVYTYADYAGLQDLLRRSFPPVPEPPPPIAAEERFVQLIRRHFRSPEAV